MPITTSWRNTTLYLILICIQRVTREGTEQFWTIRRLKLRISTSDSYSQQCDDQLKRSTLNDNGADCRRHSVVTFTVLSVQVPFIERIKFHVFFFFSKINLILQKKILKKNQQQTTSWCFKRLRFHFTFRYKKYKNTLFSTRKIKRCALSSDSVFT